jgi:hypothetical protein
VVKRMDNIERFAHTNEKAGHFGADLLHLVMSKYSETDEIDAEGGRDGKELLSLLLICFGSNQEFVKVAHEKGAQSGMAGDYFRLQRRLPMH